MPDDFEVRITGTWLVHTKVPLPKEVLDRMSLEIWELIYPIVHQHISPFVGEDYVVSGEHEVGTGVN